MLCIMTCRGEKSSKLNKKNGKTNQMLISKWGIFKVLDQRFEYDIQI